MGRLRSSTNSANKLRLLEPMAKILFSKMFVKRTFKIKCPSSHFKALTLKKLLHVLNEDEKFQRLFWDTFYMQHILVTLISFQQEISEN